MVLTLNLRRHKKNGVRPDAELRHYPTMDIAKFFIHFQRRTGHAFITATSAFSRSIKGLCKRKTPKEKESWAMDRKERDEGLRRRKIATLAGHVPILAT